MNERQIKAIKYVREKGKITNAEYQKLLNVSKRTATNDLEKLVQKLLLKKIGKQGRGIFYQIEKGNNRAKGAIKGQ